MKEVQIEVGKHHDENPKVTYVLQLIKFYDRTFDTGTVIKEVVLEKGQTMVTVYNVR